MPCLLVGEIEEKGNPKVIRVHKGHKYTIAHVDCVFGLLCTCVP